jgi:cytochrome c biogenesis protein CcmG, thiol:disulfide interchange protein DsbE
VTPDTGATEPSHASRSDAPPRRAGRLQRSVEGVLWVLVLGLVVWRFGPQAGAALGLRAGTEPAPDFVVQTLAGDSVRLSELRGKVVLINFWATWCAPCRIEMPGFQRVWEDYADRGLVIVGLSVDRGVRSDVARWVDDRGLTFPIAFAPGPVVRSYGGASVLPTSILVDPQGRIAHRVQGYYAEPALRAAVRRLLP